MAKPGFIGGKHYTEYTNDIETLKRAGRLDEAEKLLLKLLEAIEARATGAGVAPWYYEQLAIIYRKRKDYAAEVSILERYMKQPHAFGVSPQQLSERLKKARYLLQMELASKEDETQIGVSCPYCNALIAPPPKRRKKCPYCGNTVYVKPDQSLFARPLLTEEEARTAEEMKTLHSYGVTAEEFWKTEKELTEKFGQRPSHRDVLWGLYSKTITKLANQKDALAVLSWVYWHMALFAYEEGKDPEPLLRQSHRMYLKSLRSWGADRGVKIVARDDACSQCQELNGTVLTIREALAKMPLPHKACTHKEGENPYSICRCRYQFLLFEGEEEVINKRSGDLQASRWRPWRAWWPKGRGK
jgi:tetratricopeptide (TPR) repeat protein